MALMITVESDGRVLISVNGLVVGLVKSLRMEVDEDIHPVPHISIVMMDAAHLGDQEARLTIRRALLNYRALLASHPLIHVVGYRDTQPTMPAVIPPDDEEK